ncbi:hypothetical protein HPB50_017269 [Hyalomma asiaticum]|uniref:Uncharacterized protein n=1 Tax=Hyalomma asiaticum TaxID=266040 RepID=A0ACB7SVU7_HYAAI|nr:hypothetical protein HPB50_017269 [Hyalomma asiaticum]
MEREAGVCCSVEGHLVRDLDRDFDRDLTRYLDRDRGLHRYFGQGLSGAGGRLGQSVSSELNQRIRFSAFTTAFSYGERETLV